MEVIKWIILIFLIFLLGVFIKWLTRFIWKCKVMPAGPWGLPLVGYAPWLGKLPHETFARMIKKYGPIFSVSLGSEIVVVLNSWESIKASLIDQPKVFNGRPRIYLVNALTKSKDVSFTDGPVWKTQRNLTNKILKHAGVGNNNIQERLMDMIHEVTDVLNEADGQVQPINDVFFKPILKFLWKVIAGEGTEDCTQLLIKFEDQIRQTLRLVQLHNSQILNQSSWLRFVPPNGCGHWEILRVNRAMESLLKKTIDQYQARFDENNLDNFIDNYLSQIKKHQSEPPFDTESLKFTLWSLLLAGMDTTLNACQWAVLYLSYHPKVQKKAQAEVDKVIGRHRLPSLDDLPNLQYLNALIMEVHRKASLVSLSLPHRATETTIVLGHTIPKNTTVLQNIYAVHHDPQLWNEPDVFKPERFLDENNVAKAPPYFMPFSIGPRVCLGQSLADLEIRLLFACLLQQFNFSLPPGVPPPPLKGEVGFNHYLPPFSLLIHKRKD